jgi:hypothetical protein
MKDWLSEEQDEAINLVGEIVTHVDVDRQENQILLTMQSGKRYKIYHDQDCCEDVKIDETQEGDGDLVTLVGNRIDEVKLEEESDQEPRPSEYADSWTRTKITFRINSETVVSRWIGESNGYYSESVDIKRLFD